ncbi:MAG TPA: DUF3891 family protein [Vicinamibacterales bacterium]|nr:DUF3891 family protein [Vicinamibacterales bacterium]
MIVRPDRGELWLITQPDHALLAHLVMAQWRSGGLEAHPRRASILHAVAEHDNGWREVDLAPTVDADGRLHDFVSAPLDLRQGVWPRAIDRLSGDRWAAALVAEHALAIHHRFHSEPAWFEFFDAMEQRRNALVNRARRSLEDLAADYTFVRLADLMSLVFCNAWTEVQRCGDFTIRLQGDRRVVVSPDPFGGQTIAIAVPARVIPARPYRSVAEVTAALAGARWARLAGTISGGRPPN